jgi:copper resistance protein B
MTRPDLSFSLAAAIALIMTTPAFAQQADPHAGHTMPTPAPTPAPAPAPAPTADRHAGHVMPTPTPTPTPAPAPTADPHAGHVMPAAPAQPAPDPHAGHTMGTMPATGAAEGTDLPAGNAPPPPLPTDHAADRVYDPRAMAEGRRHLQEFHGGQKMLRVGFDIAEARFRKGREGYGWEGDAWYGGDIDRLWVKTEGEGDSSGALEEAEVQVLYSRAIDPYWNVQGGVRYDFKPDPSRVYATVALEGLAPSFFDVEGALFLSNKGELMARASGWYDQRITQRLVLQPRAEVNLAAQKSREIGVGAGLSDVELGLRLRYDIRRDFAPYIGVEYSRAFGRTRRYLREEGEDSDSLSLLAGVRFWF